MLTKTSSRLDLLRGFSGAEKLAYPEEVHEYVRDHGNRVFHSFVGCPPALFFRISQVLHAGKAYKAGNLPVEAFRPLLDKAGKFFHYWDPEQETYPTGAPEWTLLAEAFRHACILRVLRFPDSFAIPCTDSSVRRAASAILDICAQMPRNSAYYKRLLFPLFLAGAEMSSPHQVQYIGWCIDEIKRSTGFQYPAMLDMLLQVWEKRQSSDSDIPNIPWMEFVSDPSIHTPREKRRKAGRSGKHQEGKKRRRRLTLADPYLIRLVRKCYSPNTPIFFSSGRDSTI